jgi:hypothetical protein
MRECSRVERHHRMTLQATADAAAAGIVSALAISRWASLLLMPSDIPPYRPGTEPTSSCPRSLAQRTRSELGFGEGNHDQT